MSPIAAGAACGVRWIGRSGSGGAFDILCPSVWLVSRLEATASMGWTRPCKWRLGEVPERGESCVEQIGSDGALRSGVSACRAQPGSRLGRQRPSALGRRCKPRDRRSDQNRGVMSRDAHTYYTYLPYLPQLMVNARGTPVPLQICPQLSLRCLRRARQTVIWTADASHGEKTCFRPFA